MGEVGRAGEVRGRVHCDMTTRPSRYPVRGEGAEPACMEGGGHEPPSRAWGGRARFRPESCHVHKLSLQSNNHGAKQRGDVIILVYHAFELAGIYVHRDPSFHPSAEHLFRREPSAAPQADDHLLPADDDDDGCAEPLGLGSNACAQTSCSNPYFRAGREY